MDTPQRVALITGAARGLGLAYARALAREGWAVALNDLPDAGVEGAAQALVDEGFLAIAVVGDVSQPEQAREVVAQASARWGGLDAAICNAGLTRDRTLVRLSDEAWQAALEVNLSGAFYITRAASAMMLRRGRGGSIVHISSYAGLVGNFGQAAYGAAKAGVVGLTRTASLELEKFHITVNAVAPLAQTAMSAQVEAAQGLDPEDIAPLLVWLVGPLSRGITGRVFGAHGAHYFEYVTTLTPGARPPQGQRWTPESISARLDQICGG